MTKSKYTLYFLNTIFKYVTINRILIIKLYETYFVQVHIFMFGTTYRLCLFCINSFFYLEK